MLNTPEALKKEFLIEDGVVFINHGSFGACPRPVFEKYQYWQLEFERQPVNFFARRLLNLLNDSRAALAQYLNAPAEHLVYVPNATTGVNMVIRNLPLKEGDEILSTDHEYGACEMTWNYYCKKTGAKYIKQTLPLPATSPDALIDALFAGVTERTKVIFVSHITAPTALIMPLVEICRRARELGIMTVVDGAHAPGQIPVDLTQIGADFYSGNCHKWLCAPKGAAFLYARPEHHAIMEPLVISWGYNDTATFAGANEVLATRDYAAYLTVPDAIAYQAERNWDEVRARGHALAVETRDRINALTGIAPISTPEWIAQMAACVLPKVDMEVMKDKLYFEHHIEIPLWAHNGETIIRASFQGYNTRADYDALLAALEVLLPQVQVTA
jgi:isopenicillin-N epimerase